MRHFQLKMLLCTRMEEKEQLPIALETQEEINSVWTCMKASSEVNRKIIRKQPEASTSIFVYCIEGQLDILKRVQVSLW